MCAKPWNINKKRAKCALKPGNMRFKCAKYAFIKICTNMQNKNAAIHCKMCLDVENSYTGVDISSATKNTFAWTS